MSALPPDTALSRRGFSSPGVPAVALVSAALWSLSESLTIIAFSWTVVTHNQSALAVPFLFASRAAPSVMFGLLVGPVVDRLGSRPSVMAADAISFLCLLGLMLTNVNRDPILLVILAVSALLGTTGTVRQTGTQSLIYSLARADQGSSALAAKNLVMTFSRIAGAVGGGVLLAQLGFQSVLVLTAICLMASLTTAWRSPNPKAPERFERPKHSMRRAFRLLRHNPDVRRLALLVALAEVLLVSSIAVLPAFTTSILHGSATQLGILTASVDAGGVIILFFLTFRQVRANYRPVVVALACGGLALLAVSISPSAIVAVVPLALLGSAISMIDTTTQSMLLRSVGFGQRGAASGVWVFAIGAAPIGQLMIGGLVGAIGLRWALATVAVLDVLLVVPFAAASARRPAGSGRGDGFWSRVRMP